ncbi:MAG: DUF255 domain-containing protein, partial [Chitinivibrionales bacterium]|nr:DUF255 domain-containing protein [Chitinivibrionales bacterium]
GWPMSVFLTPDLEPFYAGTYFPPESRWGRPGFRTVLTRIAEAWRHNRGELLADAAQVVEAVRRFSSTGRGGGALPGLALLSTATRALASSFDTDFGGFGGPPKFPQAAVIQLLLREHWRSGDTLALKMATTTLDRMAEGGIHDHLAGGFHRYATDAQWLVPHFEKMLYDNAQLAVAYLEAYQATAKAHYADVAARTLQFMIEHMRDRSGAFIAALDADSDGKEGACYLWRYGEVMDVLGPEDGALFCDAYGLMPEGNFTASEPYHRNANIPHFPRPLTQLAQTHGITAEAIASRLAPLRQKLLENRATRPSPGTDDKVIASWNGLAVSALARGFRVLGEPRYRDAATEAARFLLGRLYDGAVLHRIWRSGRSRTAGFLDDYAAVVAALTDLWEIDADVHWIDSARRLAESMIRQFADTEEGGFFRTARDHRSPIARTKPMVDESLPAGNAMAAAALLRLALHLDAPHYRKQAEAVLRMVIPQAASYPTAHASLLNALFLAQSPPHEVIISGRRGASDTQTMAEIVNRRFLPTMAFTQFDPEELARQRTTDSPTLPLLEGRTMVDGKATVYICHNYTCKDPITQPSQLERELADAPKGG